MQQAGKYAFVVGLVVAVIAGFVHVGWMFWLLAILGIVVGLLNVTAEETSGFVVACIGLIISSTSLQQVPVIGEVATTVLGNVVAFVSPALLVVATKSLIEKAKD